MKRLENKVAVIYSDGTVGGAMAKSFAREGAKVFLTGRTLAKLKSVADEITLEGGEIETTQLDALDAKSVENHMNKVINRTGRIAISFNAMSIPQKGIQMKAAQYPARFLILPQV